MMRVERIGLLHLQRRRPPERARHTSLVLQRHHEVIHVHQHTRHRAGALVLSRDRDSYCALGRWTASSSAAATGEQQPLLNVYRFVLASDAGEIASDRVARCAFAGAVEVLRTCFRVARTDVLHGEHCRAAERVVQLLAQEMRDVGDLLVGQARRRLAALRRMALLQKWSDLAAVAIAKKDDRSKKIGTVIRAARLRAVTRHALRDPDVLPLVGQRKIHEWFIRRTGRATTSAAAARWRRIGLSSPCTR